MDVNTISDKATDESAQGPFSTPDGTVWSASHRMGAEPLHTGVQSEPVSTPGFWRIMTTGIMMRYLAIASIPSLFKHFFKSNSQKLAHNAKVNEEFHKIITAPAGHTDGTWGALNDALEKYDLKHQFNSVHGGAVTEPFKESLWKKISTEFEERRDVRVGKVADSFNFALFAGITGYYAWKVYQDIRNVYAETVAYETDKNPSQVTWRDLKNSDNKIVRQTLSNYIKFNVKRAVISLTALSRFIKFPKIGVDLSEINGTYVTLGLFGIDLTRDIASKRRTEFEGIVTLIDHKLNPINGLGDNVDVSELVDLYQKYAQRHDPDLAFKGKASLPMWAQGRIIFDRMTELMNNTYKPHATSNFTLPKYIFLLGQGLINPTKVDETLAYVEVANQHGMKSVRQMRDMLKAGIPLEEVLKKYPVTLPDHGHAAAHANTTPAPAAAEEKTPPAIAAHLQQQPKPNWGEQVKDAGLTEPSLQVR